MWRKFYLIFAITGLLEKSACQTVSANISGNLLSLKLCTKKETIGVQVLTNRGSGGATCQCQAAPTEDPAFKEDYVNIPGIGSYKLHINAKSWNDARKVCDKESAHLAIINSKAEEAALVEMLRKADTKIKGGLNTEEALLGIHDMYEEGDWVTIFGESLFSTGYSHWSPTYWGGQPDNFENRQNCGAVLSQGGMDDVDCRDKFAFFCELPLAC